VVYVGRYGIKNAAEKELSGDPGAN